MCNNKTRKPSSADNAHPAETKRPPLPDELERWRVIAFGDVRDDVRAALSAGTDASDDLLVIACALATVTTDDEPAISRDNDPHAFGFDQEERLRITQSTARILRNRATLLSSTFEFLWQHRLVEERS